MCVLHKQVFKRSNVHASGLRPQHSVPVHLLLFFVCVICVESIHRKPDSTNHLVIHLPINREKICDHTTSKALLAPLLLRWICLQTSRARLPPKGGPLIAGQELPVSLNPGPCFLGKPSLHEKPYCHYSITCPQYSVTHSIRIS